MDGPLDCHTEWSKSKTNIMWYHVLWNLQRKKWYKWIYLQNRNRLTDLEHKIYGYPRGKVGGRDKLEGWDSYIQAESLLYGRNEHNIVNQEHFDETFFKEAGRNWGSLF